MSTPRPIWRKTKAPPPGAAPKRKVSRWMLAAGLSIVSAIAGAVLERATNVVDEFVAPIIANSSCNLRTTFASNPAPDEPTIVLLALNGDTDQRVRSAMAELYEVNVIESCHEMRVPVSGRRFENVIATDERARALITDYDADLLLWGSVSSGRIYTAIAPQVSSFTLNDNHFDPANPRAFIESVGLQRLLLLSIQFTNFDKGCSDALSRTCMKEGDYEYLEGLLAKLQSAHLSYSKFRGNYHPRSHPGDDESSELILADLAFADVTIAIAGLSAYLEIHGGAARAANRRHGLSATRSAFSRLDLLDSQREKEWGLGKLAGAEHKSNLGAIQLLSSIRCHSVRQASEAESLLRASMEQSAADSGETSAIYYDPTRLTLLAIGQSQMVQYALGDSTRAASSVALAQTLKDFDDFLASANEWDKRGSDAKLEPRIRTEYEMLKRAVAALAAGEARDQVAAFAGMPKEQDPSCAHAY